MVKVEYELPKELFEPGEESILFLTFSNPTREDIYNIEINVLPGKYIETEKTHIKLESLPSATSQTTSLKFMINKNAKPTISHIGLEIIYYQTSDHSKKNMEITIPLKISGKPILKIEKVEFDKELKPGETVRLSFVLKNYGLLAKDVRISLNQTFFVCKECEKIIKKLEDSKEVEFEITVNPEISPNTYLIPISISFWDSAKSNEYNEKKFIGVKVMGTKNLIVTLENFYVKDYLTVKISNGGSETVKFLRVRFESDANITPEEIYIGNLDSDDYDSEKLSVSGLPGEHKLKVLLSYEDIFGNFFEEEKELKFVILGEEEKRDYTLIFYIAMLSIIVILLLKGFKR
jgi:hypothetical protein